MTPLEINKKIAEIKGIKPDPRFITNSITSIKQGSIDWTDSENQETFNWAARS